MADQTAKPAPEQPNILWITTDRQRWDTLGCMGNPFVTTPNLDRLAAGGTLFRQAWSQNPVCTPSRASFLTGRYPRTTGLVRNGQHMPPDERVISRLLADAGYMCGHSGKYHLSASSPANVQWCERRIDDGYSVFDWSMHPPATPVCQYTAWLHEHGIEHVRTPVPGSRQIQVGMDKHTSNTAWITQRAINFLSCSKGLGRPWFFTCNIEDPHEPYDPPLEFLQPYLDRLDEIPLPRYTEGELANKPPFQTTDHNGVYGGGGGGKFAASGMSEQEHRMMRAAYWAMVDHVDYQVGRMLDALEATGQRENTMVIFISDHGDMMGDHGMYMQGPYFYDEMVHVPMIMSLPSKFKAGIDTEALVELVDIAPTILDVAGLERYAGMQGRSLYPILTGAAPADYHRDDIYSEYYQSIPSPRCHREYGGAYVTCVRDREYALHCVHNLDTGELYDLQADPGMLTNLWDDPAHSSAKLRMFKKLCDRMAGTVDPLPVWEGSY